MEAPPGLKASLYQDVEELKEYLSKEGRLPCSDEPCLVGEGHVLPCPIRRLQNIRAREVWTLPGLRAHAASVLRLLPFIRCTCSFQGLHTPGCEIMTRLEWDYRMFEKYGLTRCFAAKTSGSKSLEIFHA